MQQLIAPHQYYIIILIGSLSSSLSLMGSMTIIVASRRHLRSIYQQLIFTVSMADAVTSLSYLLHPYMIPRYTRRYGLLFASGNHSTCNVAGFAIASLLIMVTFYGCYMSLYFYGKVKYNISDRTIRTKRYHYVGHIVAIIVSFGIPCFAWATIQYRPAPFWSICTWTKCEFFGADGDPGCHPRPEYKTTDRAIGFCIDAILGILLPLTILHMFRVYWTVRCTIRNYQTKWNHHHHRRPPIKDEISPTENATADRDGGDNKTLDNTTTTRNSNNNNMNRSNSFDEPEQDELDPYKNPNNHHHNDSNNNNLDDDKTKTDDDNDDDNNNNMNRSFEEPCHHSYQRRPQELRKKRQQPPPQQQQQQIKEERNMKKVIMVRNQALLYAIAYFNSIVWILIVNGLGNAIRRVMTEQIQKQQTQYSSGMFVLLCAAYTMAPLQGLCNAIVYARPRYLEFRRYHPTKGRWYAIQQAIRLQSASSSSYSTGSARYHRRWSLSSSLRNPPSRHSGSSVSVSSRFSVSRNSAMMARRSYHSSSQHIMTTTKTSHHHHGNERNHPNASSDVIQIEAQSDHRDDNNNHTRKEESHNNSSKSEKKNKNRDDADIEHNHHSQYDYDENMDDDDDAYQNTDENQKERMTTNDDDDSHDIDSGQEEDVDDNDDEEEILFYYDEYG